MKNIALMVALILCVGESAEAKPAKTVKRKPASEAYQMRVSVIFGDRHTRFLVKSSGNDGYLEMANERGPVGSKQLQKSEVDLLWQTYSKLKNIGAPDICSRSRMDITVTQAGQKPAKKSSCFGGGTEAEAPFEHFANLLSQPF